MTRHQRFLIIISIITCYLIQAQGADKYTDENRPYKFGFAIDGQQHRFEEKDKNGIIKGEYGFITADGVYHITVYATDEQGRFKILSMKNIRYADYRGLTDTSTSARQGHSLQLPSPQAVTTRQPPTTTSIATPIPQQEFEPISLEPPVNSCSHCSLPKATTIAPKPQTPLINQQSNNGNLPNNGNSKYTPSFYPKQETNSFGQAPQEQRPPNTEINNQEGFGTAPNAPSPQTGYNGIQQQAPNAPSLTNNNYEAQNFDQRPNVPASPNYYNGAQNIGQSPNIPSQHNNYNELQNAGQPPNGSSQQALNNATPNNLQATQASLGGQQGAAQNIDNADRTRTPKQFSGTPNEYTPGQSNSGNDINAPQALPNPNQKPVLAYAQMQIVDKNTDIHAKRPGEKDGLPPGFKEEDMLKLLYTFNYTLGFQAHFEEGYTNGEKRGYYYTTGRNGVRTRIDYVADKDGFRPTLSQEVFDILSDDVPKEETEKEEKYGLKGYEFKWLYFPEEKNSQSKAT